MQVFEIDRGLCTGCMECLTHCPSNAISIGAEGILVDAQRCVSCGSWALAAIVSGSSADKIN